MPILDAGPEVRYTVTIQPFPLGHDANSYITRTTRSEREWSSAGWRHRTTEHISPNLREALEDLRARLVDYPEHEVTVKLTNRSYNTRDQRGRNRVYTD